jgi:hypothetical protein
MDNKKSTYDVVISVQPPKLFIPEVSWERTPKLFQFTANDSKVLHTFYRAVPGDTA